jgi:hypothetical protein
MTFSSENINIALGWEQIAETHDILYLVKRPSYEFLFAVPRKGATSLHDNQPVFLTRFKDRCQLLGFTLEMSEMKDFYEGLTSWIEYVQVEQEKRGIHQ